MLVTKLIDDIPQPTRGCHVFRNRQPVPLPDYVEEEKADPGPARPVARKLSELPPSTDEDPNALLGKNRWLCRGSAGLWVGETGSGKSSGAMQAAILWALGKPFFGIHPIKPIKSLIIQVENDDFDLAEMKDQIMDGLGLFAEQRKQVCENILIYSEDGRTGADFLYNTFEPLLEDTRPDLTWIDPLLGFVGGDISKQEVTSAFCRSGLNPLIKKHSTALWLIHHATKPKQENGRGGRENLAYYGAGSADLFNWARATMLLREHDGCFELRLEKRWKRAGWESKSRYIAQSTDGRIYWTDAEGAGEAGSQPPTISKDERVMALVPTSEPIGKDVLLRKIVDERIASANPARDIIKALLQQGKLFEWSKPRPKTNALKFLARYPQPEGWPSDE